MKERFSRLIQWLNRIWYGVRKPAFCDECGRYSQNARLVGHSERIFHKGVVTETERDIFWCEDCYARLKTLLL